MDTTLGTNNMKFHLFTLIVFDELRMVCLLLGLSLPNKMKRTLFHNPLFYGHEHSHLTLEPRPSCLFVDDNPQEFQVFNYAFDSYFDVL